MIRTQLKRLLCRLGLYPREFYAATFNIPSGLGDSSWLLYGLARSVKPRVCVEIGSAQGKSACAIGTALRRNGFGMLYAIDPHMETKWNDVDSVDSLATMTENLRKAGVMDNVQIVRKTSEDAAAAWNQPIDLIFIDGDHSYEGVKADWERFVPHVSTFGVVVFHDTLWDVSPDTRWKREDMGVPRFVDELRTAGYPVITINQDFGVSLVQPHIGGVKLR